jgi:hypothetical protein
MLLVVAEGYFSSQWNDRYFTSGIPIFRRVLRLPRVSKRILDNGSLTNHFQRASSLFSLPSLIFRDLNSCRIAFRGEIFGPYTSIWNFFPVMRGLIRLNKEKGLLEIIGYLNWYVLGFYFLYVSIFFYVWDVPQLSKTDVILFILVYPLLVFCFCYIWHILLFNKVYNHVKRLQKEN